MLMHWLRVTNLFRQISVTALVVCLSWCCFSVSSAAEDKAKVFTLKEWDELAQKIARIPISDHSARAFSRRVFSGAVDLVPDKQGRILLPTTLREFANLEDEAVIIGMYNFAEIWSVDAWNPVRDDIENNEDFERWQNLGI